MLSRRSWRSSSLSMISCRKCSSASHRIVHCTSIGSAFSSKLFLAIERPPLPETTLVGASLASRLTAHLAHSAATGAVEGIDAVCGVGVPPPRLKAVSRGLLRLLAYTFHVEPIAVIIVVRTCTLRRSYEC